MSNFYNYDTRGASAASQIINLERMVEERDAEIEKLRNASDLDGELISNMHDEAERLRALLREFAPYYEEYDDDFQQRVREALRDE